MSLTSKDSSMLWPYRIILLILSPFVILYTLYRSIKDGGSIYFLQRLGFSLPSSTSNPTWIHCASVGEVNTALPLIQALIAEQPNITFSVSTTTPTGKKVLQKKLGTKVTHFYFPLDFDIVVNRTLKRVLPQKLILLETEIWPNLIRHCNSRQISVTIVNARLSAKTMSTYSWLLAAYRYSLKTVSAVYAKNKVEGDKFLQLGLPLTRLHIIGSLKFAANKNSNHATIDLPHKPYCLAASTHDDEELRIVSEWHKQNRQELLVIAPRHPERRDRLKKQLDAIGPAVQLRSQEKVPRPETQVYIADTLGELDGFIHEALVVFVGGSLIPRGGHNIVEAARPGKAVITGASINNFNDEFQWLDEHDAIVLVENEQQLVNQMCELLEDDERRNKLAKNASKACATQSDVIDRYMSVLSEKS